ncbi:MAG: hypothetical protein NVSMB4_01500 [Acidimicrobiales bacterium]
MCLQSPIMDYRGRRCDYALLAGALGACTTMSEAAGTLGVDVVQVRQWLTEMTVEGWAEVVAHRRREAKAG